MTNNKAIADHYVHGDLLQAIQASIAKLGKTIDILTVEDLAPVDEFHIGGRLATENLLNQLSFSEKHHVLDVGCGLGGAARYVVNKYNNRVTGIDLTQEYIEAGKVLSAWVGLEKKVALQHGSATEMPFEDSSFDGGYMLHVGMNIEDKELLFEEIYRVLRPGASFGVYDVMRNKEGELAFPVPWATDKSTSKLATPNQYKKALSKAGFKIYKENARRDFALEFFRLLREKTESISSPPPLGLHTLMKESTSIKLKNMIENILANYIVPVEIVAQKI